MCHCGSCIKSVIFEGAMIVDIYYINEEKGEKYIYHKCDSNYVKFIQRRLSQRNEKDKRLDTKRIN